MEGASQVNHQPEELQVDPCLVQEPLIDTIGSAEINPEQVSTSRDPHLSQEEAHTGTLIPI